MKKWIIIGGGIQGCTMASYLRKNLGIQAHDMSIIDTKEQPLQNWRQFTKKIGMSYLRSPSIHHIDPSPFALEKYAKQHRQKECVQFYAPYDRPDLQLFNQHCQEVLAHIDIQASWVQGRVIALEKLNHFWTIKLEDGTELQAQKVVIAIGLSDQLRWPDWAKKAKTEGANITHVFDELDEVNVKNSIVIIGGGISAAHAAIKWSKLIPGKVAMITRKPLAVHQFDADPGWLGPKHMNKFSKINCFTERRKVITEARHPGSLPIELKTEIERQKKLGNLEVIVDEVVETSNGELSLKSAVKRNFETILLATGFEQKPPGMDWLQGLIETYCLPCAGCGYPIPKPSLEWEEGLYLLVALAELQLGPVARNISGARRGAERIIASF